MGKAINIGVSNVARKGKSGCIGVSNVARKIKKAWVGDASGKAREFFSSAEPFYWIKDGTVQDGFPSTYATFSLSPSTVPYYYYSNELVKASVCGVQESNSVFTGETATVATQGNKYIEVTFNSTNVTGKTGETSGVLNSFKIGGVDVTSQVTENAVITVDVSSMSEVTLCLQMTAWAWGNWASMHIASIRFYS